MDAVRAQVEGHRILIPDSLSVSEEDQRSADGTSLEAPDCGSITSLVEETDVNDDGVAEVFVLAGNTCTSGHDGSSLTLFIRDSEGRYAPHLGFSAGGWTRLETGNGEFSDLAIGGPDFCEAVYRWDGSTYQHHHNRETSPGGCDGIG